MGTCRFPALSACLIFRQRALKRPEREPPPCPAPSRCCRSRRTCSPSCASSGTSATRPTRCAAAQGGRGGATARAAAVVAVPPHPQPTRVPAALPSLTGLPALLHPAEHHAGDAQRP